jgi:hypothetical protein
MKKLTVILAFVSLIFPMSVALASTVKINSLNVDGTNLKAGMSASYDEILIPYIVYDSGIKNINSNSFILIVYRGQKYKVVFGKRNGNTASHEIKAIYKFTVKTS